MPISIRLKMDLPYLELVVIFFLLVSCEILEILVEEKLVAEH